MQDFTGAVSDAMKALIEASISADQKLLEKHLGELAGLVGDGDKAAITAFFKADPEGVKLYLTKGIQPTSFAGQRFLSLLGTLQNLLGVMYEGEVRQIDTFLSAASLSPAQKAAVYTKSLFMSPTIKQRLLDEWVNKPWKGHKLSERIWDFSKVSQDSLLKLVATNFAEGKNPNAIKPIIRKVMGTQSDYVLRRLLLTESSRVWQGVQKAAISEFKHVKYVKLNYGNRHKVKCSCTPWHDKGNIPYDDAPDMPIHVLSSSYLQPIPTPVAEWKKANGFE